MCFRNIAAFVPQHATFPHPTSILPQISSCFLGIGGWPLGYMITNSEGVGLIVRTISFQDFQPM